MKKTFNIASIAAFALLACFSGAYASGVYGGITIDTVQVTQKKNGKPVIVDEVIATIDGSSNETISIPTDITVDSVYYKRSFKSGAASTIMLPFTVDAWRLKNVSCWKYAKVTKPWDGGEWTVYVNHVYAGLLEANTPYLVLPQKDMDALEFDISFNRDTVVFNTTKEGDQTASFSDKYGTWKIRGTYEYKEWKEGDSDLGCVYGFAAKNKNDVQIGEFVKVAPGAYARPMRAYMTYSKPSVAAKSTEALFAADEELPETIAVNFLDEEGEVAAIGRMNTTTGKISVDKWFDMKGRKLEHKPTVKGTYYNNGKKVIVK